MRSAVTNERGHARGTTIEDMAWWHARQEKMFGFVTEKDRVRTVSE